MKYSGENNYLVVCWICSFAHLQRNFYSSFILMEGDIISEKTHYIKYIDWIACHWLKWVFDPEAKQVENTLLLNTAVSCLIVLGHQVCTDFRRDFDSLLFTETLNPLDFCCFNPPNRFSTDWGLETGKLTPWPQSASYLATPL